MTNNKEISIEIQDDFAELGELVLKGLSEDSVAKQSALELAQKLSEKADSYLRGLIEGIPDRATNLKERSEFVATNLYGSVDGERRENLNMLEKIYASSECRSIMKEFSLVLDESNLNDGINNKIVEKDILKNPILFGRLRNQLLTESRSKKTYNSESDEVASVEKTEEDDLTKGVVIEVEGENKDEEESAAGSEVESEKAVIQVKIDAEEDKIEENEEIIEENEKIIEETIEVDADFVEDVVSTTMDIKEDVMDLMSAQAQLTSAIAMCATGVGCVAGAPLLILAAGRIKNNISSIASGAEKLRQIAVDKVTNGKRREASEEIISTSKEENVASEQNIEELKKELEQITFEHSNEGMSEARSSMMASFFGEEAVASENEDNFGVVSNDVNGEIIPELDSNTQEEGNINPEAQRSSFFGNSETEIDSPNESSDLGEAEELDNKPRDSETLGGGELGEAVAEGEGVPGGVNDIPKMVDDDEESGEEESDDEESGEEEMEEDSNFFPDDEDLQQLEQKREANRQAHQSMIERLSILEDEKLELDNDESDNLKDRIDALTDLATGGQDMAAGISMCSTGVGIPAGLALMQSGALNLANGAFGMAQVAAEDARIAPLVETNLNERGKAMGEMENLESEQVVLNSKIKEMESKNQQRSEQDKISQERARKDAEESFNRMNALNGVVNIPKPKRSTDNTNKNSQTQTRKMEQKPEEE